MTSPFRCITRDNLVFANLSSVPGRCQAGTCKRRRATRVRGRPSLLDSDGCRGLPPADQRQAPTASRLSVAGSGMTTARPSIRSPPPIVPTSVAAPVVRLTVYSSLMPSDSFCSAANAWSAWPPTLKMSKPTRLELAMPSGADAGDDAVVGRALELHEPVPRRGRVDAVQRRSRSRRRSCSCTRRRRSAPGGGDVRVGRDQPAREVTRRFWPRVARDAEAVGLRVEVEAPARALRGP